VLAKPPSKVTINDIVHAMDGAVTNLECVDDPSTCPLSKNCPTRGIWLAVRRSCDQVLEGKTLADLVKENLPQ